MKKIISLAAVALFGLTTHQAQAFTVDVGLNVGPTATLTSGGPAVTGDVALGSLGGSLALVNSTIITAGVSSATASSPTGTLFGGTYLAVMGSPTVASATLTLPTGENTFAFTAGTLDNYNSLTITDSRNVTYTVTGASVLAAFNTLTNGVSQADFVLSDPFGTISSIVFSSTGNSFEVANFTETSAVPLPATLPLFALGLMGLVAMGRRKGQNQA